MTAIYVKHLLLVNSARTIISSISSIDAVDACLTARTVLIQLTALNALQLTFTIQLHVLPALNFAIAVLRALVKVVRMDIIVAVQYVLGVLVF